MSLFCTWYGKGLCYRMKCTSTGCRVAAACCDHVSCSWYEYCRLSYSRTSYAHRDQPKVVCLPASSSSSDGSTVLATEPPSPILGHCLTVLSTGPISDLCERVHLSTFLFLIVVDLSLTRVPSGARRLGHHVQRLFCLGKFPSSRSVQGHV